MASTKRDRKWVIRAMVAFVVILALLTFFSNTIMNATIPKVTGVNAVRGNLSYTNNATSTIDIANKKEVKGIEGREVDKVLVGDYETVYEGDVIVTLKDLEDQSELESLQDQLTKLKRQAEYDERTPSDPTDYTQLNESVTQANRDLTSARETLAAAQNKDATIAAAQSVINSNQATAVSLQAQVTSASDTLESIQAEISELQSQIATIDSQINVFVTLGVPTPTPQDPNAPILGTDGENVPELSDDEIRVAELCAEKEALQGQIAELELQLGDAQARLSSASAQLAEVNALIEDAQATIAEAQALPSVSEAQSAVNLAQSGVTSAQRALSNAQINDGIAYDQAQDAVEDLNKQIESLETQIEKLEKKINATEIVAPCDGYVYGMTLASGDIMTDTVIFTIIPNDPECTISFTFSTNAAQSLWVGMDLSTDYWGISQCVITKIKPDSANPRESRIVECALQGDYLYPGDRVTVTADRTNSTYDHVVPASAVNEDNSGKFVYVIQQSSSPLGDKYTVKRVSVEVENTDGSLSAIKGDGLDNGMIVTRSEEPLHDGDRVRLEDYSGEK